MASDAHAHLQDLLHIFPGAEEERRSLGIACAASSSTAEEYYFHKKMASAAIKDGAPPLYLCFAVHPQLPAARTNNKYQINNNKRLSVSDFQDELDLLATLAAEGRIAAVGEAGFDLYSDEFRKTETLQDELFAIHLDIADRHNLPLVLHVRRAMHKIFPYAKILKKLPAVLFHSWPGASDEAFSLLRKGIRVFFSFGTTLLLNHKNAIRSCAALPADNLLLETDAPYQPLRGKEFSSWKDMHQILAAAAAIRKESGAGQGTSTADLQELIDRNFWGIFKQIIKTDPTKAQT